MPARTQQLKLAAMKASAHLPEAIWHPLGHLAVTVLSRRVPKPVRQWQLNAQVMTGLAPSRQQTREALWSWLRNTVGSLQLGQWGTQKINSRVRVPAQDMQRLLKHHAQGGLVLALPHMGSWDLAGAWACLNGLPVTSVAEKLPQGQFEYFQAIRAKLGFRIFAHGTTNLINRLVAEVDNGRVVCLVCDRDFGHKGIPVNWQTAKGRVSLTLPVGPALVAQRAGATLVPVSCTFDGPLMRIHIGASITSVPGRDGLGQMTQQLADYFSQRITTDVVDWHMLQRFFPGVSP